MSKSDVVQRLLEELNNQNQIYIAIIALVLVFFGVMQWRFSDKQIKKMKDDFKKDFKIEEINNTLKEANRKSEKLSTALSDARKTEAKLLEQFHVLQNQDLEGKLQFLESESGNTNTIIAINQLRVVRRTMIPMIKNQIITPVVLIDTLISFSNVSYLNVEGNFVGNEEYRKILNRLIETLIEYAKTSIAERAEFKKQQKAISNQIDITNKNYNKYKKMCENKLNNQENK